MSVGENGKKISHAHIHNINRSNQMVQVYSQMLTW